jgi:hypothetical protein
MSRMSAAAERPDPGHKLTKGERLGEVVVGAEVDGIDPVGDLPCRGQHQHAPVSVPGDQLPADPIVVHDRQVTDEG